VIARTAKACWIFGGFVQRSSFRVNTLAVTLQRCLL
jgi:hypothetical protein